MIVACDHKKSNPVWGARLMLGSNGRRDSRGYRGPGGLDRGSFGAGARCGPQDLQPAARSADQSGEFANRRLGKMTGSHQKLRAVEDVLGYRLGGRIGITAPQRFENVLVVLRIPKRLR